MQVVACVLRVGVGAMLKGGEVRVGVEGSAALLTPVEVEKGVLIKGRLAHLGIQIRFLYELPIDNKCKETEKPEYLLRLNNY